MDIKATVISVVRANLSIANDKEITMESAVIDDLGADSLDVVEIVMALEDSFKISIPDETAEKLRTIGDICDYIAQCQKD